MFPINSAVLPTLQTRQALVVIDLQNDFVSSDGALPVRDPEGFVSRIVDVASAFRTSGRGDVIWVRSEYECHRPLTSEGDQIVTVEAVQRRARHAPSSSSSSSSRGRQPTSAGHDAAAKETDPEAFLSAPPGSDKPECVRPGTDGAELAPEAAAAVDAADFSLTKSHYSAFASGPQLLRLLRGRFVTELYVCGALTNISIYATALDAGRHGYEMTILEDCCGYRSSTRHTAALTRLMELTGCEVMSSDDLVEKLQPAKKSEDSGEEEGGGDEEEEETTTDSGKGGGATEEHDDDDDDDKDEPEDRSRQKQHRRPDVRRHSRDKMGGDRGASGSSQRNIGISKQRSSVRPPAAAALDEDVSSSLHLSLRNLSLSGASSAVPSTSSSAGHRRPDLQPPLLSSPPREAGAPAEPLRHVVGSSKKSKKSKSKSPGDTSKRLESDRTPSKSAKTADAGKRGPTPSPRMSDAERSAPISVRETPPLTTLSPSSRPTDAADRQKMDRPEPSAPVASEPLCEGDTTIICNVLPPPLASTAFERLRDEVEWQCMSQHGGEVPRLVAVQGAVDSRGDMPVYRHPSDESPPLRPFSPAVSEIKAAVEAHLGHPLNHVLIQLYRGGTDYISEHSDKTLDIVRGSFIANVSLGAERTMVFRTKRPDKDPSREPPKDDQGRKRQTERAALSHNSLCRMGPATNMRWLHAIRRDGRLDRDKNPAELAFGGQRISLTFRRIGTFLDASQKLIWGQGAVAKTRDAARPVASGPSDEATRMLRAFGTENQSSEFDWERHYGGGFDVLHMTALPSSSSPRWFGGSDTVANMGIALMLADLGVPCARGDSGSNDSGSGSVRFVDGDILVEGQMAVMLYVDAVYGRSGNVSRPELARRLTRFQQALGLSDWWRAFSVSNEGRGAASKKTPLELVRRELSIWEFYAREAAAGDSAVYMAGGGQASLVDFCLWPVLHDMERVYGAGFLSDSNHLAAYLRQVGESKAAVHVIGELAS